MTVDNDYTAEEALSLIISRIAEFQTNLSQHIQAVINAGHDVVELEPRPRRGRGRPRTYRRTVPFSFDEALEVVVEALSAYFVELPLMIDSALDDLRDSATLEVGADSTDNREVGQRSQDLAPVPDDFAGFSVELAQIPTGVGTEKVLEIELQTETQITSLPVRQNLPLHRTGLQAILAQEQNLRQLAELLGVEVRWQPLRT